MKDRKPFVKRVELTIVFGVEDYILEQRGDSVMGVEDFLIDLEERLEAGELTLDETRVLIKDYNSRNPQ